MAKIRSPFVTKSKLMDDILLKPIEKLVADKLTIEEITSAKERGRNRDLEITVRELLAELEEQITQEGGNA